VITLIPLIGGLLGAVAATRIGTTVVRGVLGGLITGVVADVVITERRRRQQPQIADPESGELASGLDVISDGQGGLIVLNPPATPGELAGIMGPTSCPQGMVLDGNIPSRCVAAPSGGGSDMQAIIDRVRREQYGT